MLHLFVKFATIVGTYYLLLLFLVKIVKPIIKIAVFNAMVTAIVLINLMAFLLENVYVRKDIMIIMKIVYVQNAHHFGFFIYKNFLK